MSQTCANCGLSNRDTNRFCSNCGTALSPGVGVPAVSGPGTTGMSADLAPAGQNSAHSDPIEPVAYVVQRWEADHSGEPADQIASIPPPPYTGGYAGGSGAYQQPTQRVAPPGAQPYMPEATTRKAATSYVPYSNEAARHIDAPKSHRSWLVPVIAVTALLLLGLVGLSFYLASKSGTGSQAVVTQIPSTSSSGLGLGAPPPATASEDDKIRYAVRQGSADQIKAWHDLDTEPLKNSYTGAVLNENIDTVEMLKQRNVYATPQNQRFDITDVKVQGDQATVHTIEVWTVSFYGKADNKLVESRGPDTLSEMYTLVKQNGKWLISKLVIYNAQGTPTTE